MAGMVNVDWTSVLLHTVVCPSIYFWTWKATSVRVVRDNSATEREVHPCAKLLVL